MTDEQRELRVFTDGNAEKEISMEILSVFDDEFRRYGEVIEGLDTAEMLSLLDTKTESPDDGTIYVADDADLDALKIHQVLSDHLYGGMPIQIGYCNGTNSKLNCLEWHRGAEFNVSSSSFVLLLAKIDDIAGGKIDSSSVKAFRVPEGVPVLVYETTLHYAPCGKNFRVIVGLPEKTNTEKPAIDPVIPEDKYLWARNKWLFAHPDSSEAAQGAYVGIMGENIDIAENL